MVFVCREQLKNCQRHDDDDYDDDDDDDDTSWNLGQNRRRRRSRCALFSHYADSDILKIAFFRVTVN